MANVIQPPPTYAEVVIENPIDPQKYSFNPIWLKWFLDLAAFTNDGSGGITSVALSAPGIFTVAGSPLVASGTITLGLATQTANKVWASATSGGAATPAFRALVRADIPGSYATLPSNIAVGASPFTYQNSSASFDADVIVSGGTVTDLSFTRDNATFYTTGLTAGMFRLSPSDRLRVTHAGAPTMTLVLR